jgi:phosphatidylserine/phosphatidylglycerophosphate/cardiolipin synthase-like enzyme
MRLIVQPEDGLAPILKAVKQAKTRIELVIFRFDISELEEALAAAVKRGVEVHALVAHTNTKGEKQLRALESRLLGYGVSVDRTADELVRYHGKLLVIDNRRAFILGFNYTYQDIRESRSFGVVVAKKSVVRQIQDLIAADASRQDFAGALPNLVISPENSRVRLSDFIRKARRELLIYDPNISDDAIIRLLKSRASAGVAIRILGKLEKKWRGEDFLVEATSRRLHVRAIVRDRNRAFVGSQSLRKLELDGRREVGIIVRDPKVVGRIAAIFEKDWKLTPSAQRAGSKGKRKSAAGDKKAVSPPRKKKKSS